MRRLTIPVVVLVLGTALAYHAAATASYAPNYPGSTLEVDRTGDAVQALASADFPRFFATQPAIGPVSVIVRAPFAAIARIGHDLQPLPARYHGLPPLAVPDRVLSTQLRLYRFGIFPCLMALVILAAAGAFALGRCGRGWKVQLLVAGSMLGIPLWADAISLGHPDEFVTTGLTLGAVLTAVRGRPTAAGVLMGLALASKQWAILALPAAAIATHPGTARRLVLAAAVAYVALMIPMAIGNPSRFYHAMTGSGAFSHGFVDADTIWFPLAPHHDVRVFDGVQYVRIPQRRLPHAVETAIHPLTVLFAVALTLWYWRKRRSTDAAGIFLLLALIFLVRCMVDPVTNAYYHSAFLASLALYEGFSARRLPILALIVTAFFLPKFSDHLPDMNYANALYLTWSVPLLAFLAWSLKRSTTAPEAVSGGRDRA